MGLLEGKTALITGAARGIGKAIALKFAAEGANIAFTDLEINEETEKEIAALGVKAKSYASNAADFAQTEEVVKAVKEEFGSIDILVNNAGITKDGLMLRMTGLQLHPRLRARHDAPAWWFYHQYGLCRGCSRQCWSGKLCGLKGWSDRPRQEYRTGDGSQGHPCQRHRSWLHRDGYDSSPARRGSRAVEAEDSSPSWWSGRGYRQRGYLPRIRHVELRQRTGDPG